MRGILALDVGEARIGVAVSPPGTSFVFGRETISRSNLSTDLQKIYDLADIEKATLIVVGLPVRTDGKESVQAKRICSFTEAIRQPGLEVTFEAERYKFSLLWNSFRCKECLVSNMQLLTKKLFIINKITLKHKYSQT